MVDSLISLTVGNDMLVLGIDPGTVTMGYGIVEAVDNDLTLIDQGTLTEKAASPIDKRLCSLYSGLCDVICQHKLDVIAIEQPFLAKNVRSALAVGRAQAVAILAAATNSIPVFEYTPTRVKQLVTDYGASSKAQVQRMVMLQLGLTEVPKSSDATDALAVAICHIRETHLDRFITDQR